MKIEQALKQSRFESPQQKAWINLIFTSNVLNDFSNTIFKDFDLTPQQYNVLRILKGRIPESASCSSVKEVMLDKNPDLTRLCDRLVTKGLIVRETDSDNRRQVNLRITEEGIKLIDTIKPILKEYNHKLNNLSDEEAEILSDLLDKLRG
jgi:MarR family transcriptional regulator, 2-MHQ and catechol-resistance regulon repressor